MTTTRSYVITKDAIHRERQRTLTEGSTFDASRVIELVERPLELVGPIDVKLRILAVSIEHNVTHAAAANYVDIVEAHGGKLYPGNSAIAEVIEAGREVTSVRAGDIVQAHCNGKPDPYGYPERIWGYDVLGSVGWYGMEAVVSEWQVLLLPLDCGLTLWEMAALPLRAPTAHHLWRRALAMFRAKVSEDECPVLNVLSFGGGVGELFLMLARSAGHAAYLCAGNHARREALRHLGIHGIDQLRFNRFGSEQDVADFKEECRQITGGVGMHVVCDMFRGPVFAAGLAVASREGVNVSAGWQLSQRVTYNSATQSVKQVTLDHVHYETVQGCAAATQLYGTVFKPHIHHELYSFEDLPRGLREMQDNVQTGIPIVRVADRLPASVTHLTTLPRAHAVSGT
jgi:NADPH:quinone reductase-like Zn-dependent oxidoreductase